MRISVLIPCHNASAYIQDALESAFSQGVDFHEVVVVDDGSTDGSADRVRAFGGKVRVYRQSNVGISRARNAALAFATGDIIAFLDADDVWPEDSVRSRLEALLTDESIEYAYGWVEQFISPELGVREAGAHANARLDPRPARLAGAMLVRSRAFATVGSFSLTLRVGETLDWVARADELGVRSSCIPQIVLRRRLHETNTGLVRHESQSDYLALARDALARRREARTGDSASVGILGDRG